MNNLLLILAMMVLSNGNGNISLFDNKNKSNKSFETTSATTMRGAEVEKQDKITDSQNSGASKRTGPKIRKIKKIRKKTKPRESTVAENTFRENSTVENSSRQSTSRQSTSRDGINRGISQFLNFDMGDVNKGIKLLDLSEEDLDRGMEIITRTKKYMNRDERNILIKLESILDLVKGIKKLNEINILSDQEESDFFRSMEDEDKKNMMIKEILEVFPENKKQSFEKALDMKKKIDLFAELFLPDVEDGGGGFSLSSLADLSNLGSISNLKMLSSLLRGFDSNDDDDEDEGEEEYTTVEDDVEERVYQDVTYEEIEDNYDYDEYVEVNKAISNNKKYNKNKVKKNPSRRKKTSSKK